MEELKPCPFCGKTPETDHHMDTAKSKHGKYGHYARINACCKVLNLGRTELFFADEPNPELWESMCRRTETDWNKRITPTL